MSQLSHIALAPAALLLVTVLASGCTRRPAPRQQPAPQDAGPAQPRAGVERVGPRLDTAAAAAEAPAWRPVTGPSYSVSGLARLENPGRAPEGAGAGTFERFLAIHDNRPDDRPRVSLLTVTGVGAACSVTSLALEWPSGTAPPPKDLEAICRVPGQANHFLVLTSAGKLARISYEPGASKLKVESPNLPDLTPQPQPGDDAAEFEGLCLAVVGDQTVLLWSTRGYGTTDAQIYGGTVDANFNVTGTRPLKLVSAPVPLAGMLDVRRVADLRVDERGWVWAVAARDPPDKNADGDPFNDGPFASAVFVVGSLGPGPAIEPPPATQAAVAPTPDPIEFPANKVEAIEFYGSNRLLIGTDDEDLGGFVQARER